MKKALLLLYLFLIPVFTSGYAQESFWTNTGNYDTKWYNDAKTEFILSTPAQLAGLAYLVNNGNKFYGKIISLNNDIDLEEHLWIPIGAIKLEQYYFCGIFDGKGYTISHMKIKGAQYEDHQFLGLFGMLCGKIYNITLNETCEIQPHPYKNYIGGIAGLLNRYGDFTGHISGCTNRANITTTLDEYGGGSTPGGITGGINTGTIVEKCINTGNITGSTAGGIVGGLNGAVTECQNFGAIKALTFAAGGIAGSGVGLINKCENDGSVTSETMHHDMAAAGIIGYAEADGFQGVEDCINSGTIKGLNAAGIVGYLRSVGWYIRKIQNCHNKGNILGRLSAGGIIASNGSALIVSDCINSGTISAKNTETFKEGSYTYAPSAIAGGIGGSGTICINCCNYGSVSAYSKNIEDGYMAISSATCGGIAGGGSATNCFNQGNLSANCHAETNSGYYDASASLSIGGILGSGSASNCYNTGELSHSSYCHTDAGAHKEYLYKGIGGIIGGGQYDFDVTLQNCYYTNEGIECYPKKGYTGYMTHSEMQTQAFVDKLNAGKSPYFYEYYNQSFPACSWMLDSSNGLPAFDTEPTSIQNVFEDGNTSKSQPLFTNNIVSDYAQLNVEPTEPFNIYIYTSNGTLVDRYSTKNKLLDMSKYSNGTYIVAVKNKSFSKSSLIIIKH